MQSYFHSIYHPVRDHQVEIRRSGDALVLLIDGKVHVLSDRAQAERARDSFNDLGRELHQQIERTFGPYFGD